MTALRDISVDEWNEFDWTELGEWGRSPRVFIKGARKTNPPQDGYVYKDCTRFGDAEQRWERAKTYVKEGE
jgi:hypothetical protein